MGVKVLRPSGGNTGTSYEPEANRKKGVRPESLTP
jgi:hypothetical protein